MKMILNNSIELEVKNIVDTLGDLEIEFTDGTRYEEISSIYDESIGQANYSQNALRRFELYSDQGELQGTHLGYSITKNISAFNGVVKVTLQKEDELKTEVETLRADLFIAQAMIEELKTQFKSVI